MKELSKVEDLAQRVVDGMANASLMAELEQLMSEDPSARIVYLQTLQLHHDLERKSARGTLSEGTTSTNVLTDMPPATPVALEGDSPPRKYRLLAAASAMIVVMFAIAFFVLSAGRREVGEIVEVSKTSWVGSPPGKRLHGKQRLQLTSGAVELRLASGVRVVLKNNVDAVLRSPMEIALNRGQLYAAVPQDARGFRVQTPAGFDVIDRGTLFGVRIDEAGADVHVFEGEVDVKPSSDTQAMRTLMTAQAARFSPKGKLQNWLVPDYEGFAAPLLAPGVVSTSASVHWFENPPTTFGHTNPRSVALVLERRNVLLESPLDITFDRHKTGTNSAYDTHRRVLVSGTRVDSYLLHFSSMEAGKSTNGGVQFERPILGVIARGDQLNASDAAVGRRDLTYPTDSARGLEGDSDALDVIRMEHDQISVKFSGNKKGLDQVRILVEARSSKLLQPQNDE